MYSYTKNWKDYIYNQNTINNFWPDCTEVSIAQIFGLTYDIWLEEDKLVELVDKAIEDWVLTITWASFSTIYPYNAKMISEATKEDVSVYKTYIWNLAFEKHLKEGYTFGLWLLMWNHAYMKALSNWELTKDDIDNMADEWGWFQHNHTYSYEDGEFWIYEIYKWTRVKCPLEVLEYGVSKGCFWSPARTFKFSNELLTKALFNYKKWVNIENVQDLSKDEQEAIGRASKLRVFKK